MRRLRVRGLVSRASGGLGRHRPAQLHGSVRQRAGGVDESGRKPVESRAFEWAPLSVSRRRSRDLRKTPRWSAERRAGPRYGPAIPSADGRGHAARQANGCGVPRPRISALRYPHLEGRRVRNRQFGTTVRRDAPRGNAPPRLNKARRNDEAEIEEPRFGETNPRDLRSGVWRNEPEIFGVAFWRNEPGNSNSFNGRWPAKRNDRRHRA